MKPLRLLFRTNNAVSTLFLRLTLALAIFPHGAQKALGWFGGYGFQGTMGFFTGQMHIPAFFALLAIAAEFAGAIALVLGLFTRVAAFGISVTMAVAVAMAHWQHGFFMNWYGTQQGEGIEFHLLAIGAGIALIIAGGGKLSLDRFITERLTENDEARPQFSIQQPAGVTA